jgi:hypothetical protein
VRTVKISPAELSPQAITGRVLAAEVTDDRGKVAVSKGEILTASHAETLERLPWRELHLIELEAGDLHEDDAGERIAKAAAGAGVESAAPVTGAWPLVARHRGILQVEPDPLRRLNLIDGISASTLLDGQIVEEGETVAVVKIVPLVIEEAGVQAACEIGSEGEGVVRVGGFRPARIGAVVVESGTSEQRRRFQHAAACKVEWFGSCLLEPAYADPGTPLGAVLERVLGDAPDVVMVVGARPLDPLDPIFAALERVGARMQRIGFPAHPGSLLWLARLGTVVILGIPSPALVAKATALDVALPRILAGEPAGPADLANLGHGGLLTTDMTFRLPRYAPGLPRGEAPRDG